jgi:23S rRNA pseudouridine1911/1915/1917 synthase
MPELLTFHVPSEGQGERLDRYLALSAPGLTRARIKTLIDEGGARVDGAEAKASRKLKAGQQVTLEVPDPAPLDLVPDPGVQFRILYQDPHLVVIDKPAGLVVHPAAGHATGTLVQGLLAACPDLEGVGGVIRPGIVHRLDKDTSGVMVAAKTDAAHQALVVAFKERRIQKIYLALCQGRPPRIRGEIDAPIGRHPARRKEMSVHSRSGRPALTGYEMLAELGLGVTVMRLTLGTGRTHQIRVHLAFLGCPVVGDSVYGRGLGPLKHRTDLKPYLGRQMLHAFRLGFDHPVTGAPLLFEAPIPEDMCRVAAALDPEGQSFVRFGQLAP